VPLIACAILALILGVIGGTGEPETPMWIVVGVVAAVLVFTSPFGALVAWVLVLFLRPTDFFPDLAEYRPALYLGALSAFLLLTGKLLKKDLSLVSSRQNLWIILLGIAVFISAVNSLDRFESMVQFKEIFVKVVLFWFLAINTLTSRHRAVVFQWTLGVAVAALGGWALYSHFWGPPPPVAGDPSVILNELFQTASTVDTDRAFLVKGLLEDPNDLALAQLMATPFLIEAWLGAKGPKKWLFAILMVLPIGGILMTRSRGGLLGLAVAMFVLFRGRIKSRLVTITLVGVLMTGAVIASGVRDRESGGKAESGIDMSSQGRLDAWRSGLHMAQSRPLTGIGFKMFNDYYLTYAIDPAEWLPGKSAHNAYVLCVAETGLLGFIPFMMLVWCSVRVNGRLRKRAPPDLTRAQRALLRSQDANIAGVLTAAFFLSVTWHYYLYILFVQAASNEVIFLKTEGQSVADHEGEDSASVALDAVPVNNG